VARVVHFELAVDDPERAAAFWSTAFGWGVTHFGEGPQDYWLVDTGDGELGINGGFVRRQDFPAPVSTICTVGVADCEAAVTAVETAGGSVLMPRMALTGVGWLAYCRDTEGTVFGVWQADETAR